MYKNNLTGAGNSYFKQHRFFRIKIFFQNLKFEFTVLKFEENLISSFAFYRYVSLKKFNYFFYKRAVIFLIPDVVF